MKVADLQAFGVEQNVIDAWSANGHESLLPIQDMAVRRAKVLDGGSTVVFSPTSSGKTFIGEMAAVKMAHQEGRVMYLVPQKALAEEKYREFRRKYESLGVEVVISTRDRNEHDTAIRRGEYHIAVVVFEKLQALVVLNPGLLSGVQLAVVDEMQMIGDHARGAGLEILLTKILLTKPRPQIIGLSAVLGNAHALAAWLGATLCENRKRPVELRKGTLFDGDFRYVEHNSRAESVEVLHGGGPDEGKRPDRVAAQVCRFIRAGEQCLVFCKSRKESIQIARRIAKVVGRASAAGALEDLSHLEDSRGRDLLQMLLKSGVAYHNSDLDWDQRDVIERWFREGEITALCATSTLAMGLNLPARNVIIDPKRWHRHRLGGWMLESISQAEYENMCGRAGRLGLEDKFGRAIIVTESWFDDRVFYDAFVKKDLEDVTPSLRDTPLGQHALNLVASGLCRTADEVREVLLGSYTGSLHWRGQDEESFQKRLDEGMKDCLKGGLIELVDEKLHATKLGKLAAAKGIGVSTAIKMAVFARATADMAATVHAFEILWCLAGTEGGEDVYLNMSTDEYRSGRYRKLFEAYLGVLPRMTRDRIAAQLNGDLAVYEGVQRAKKTLLLYEWIGGASTRSVEGRFECYSGSAAGLAGEFAWLVEAMAGVAGICDWSEGDVARLAAMARQLLYGVPEEGVTLGGLGVRGLGRGRIATLVSHGLTTPDRVIGAPLESLQALVTKPVAARLLKRAHEVIEARRTRRHEAAAEPESADLEPAVLPAPQREYAFQRQGQMWMVTFAGESVFLKHAVGLAYLAHLLRAPHKQVFAPDLLAAVSGNRRASATGSAGEQVDGETLDALKERYLALRAELAEAEHNHDEAAQTRAEAELEHLTDYLRQVKGLGGRARRANDDAEKIRKSVSQAIGRAIGWLRNELPVAAQHLDRAVRCGLFLSYEPEEEVPWNL